LIDSQDMNKRNPYFITLQPASQGEADDGVIPPYVLSSEKKDQICYMLVSYALFVYNRVSEFMNHVPTGRTPKWAEESFNWDKFNKGETTS
jgi:hypothetical protein